MMKKLSNSFLTCLIVLIILSDVSVAQTYRLQLEKSGLDMPVLFEDQKISEEVKNNVLGDFASLFGHLPEYNRSTRRKPEEVKIGYKDFKIVGAIYFSDEVLPDAYEKDFMLVCVSQASQEEYIYVPKHLSDGYQQVMALKAEYEGAFLKLDNFINFLNNLEQEVKDKNISDLREFINFAQESKIPADYFCPASMQEFVNGYKEYTFKMASLLELRRGDVVLKARQESIRPRVAEAIEGLDKAVIYTKMHAIEIQNGEQSTMVEGIAYFNDGKWKLLR